MPTQSVIPKSTPPSSTSWTGSALWLGLDRSWRLIIGFFVSLLVIRHLGPEKNGLLQTGLALAAIMSSMIELGLESIVRRQLVREPERGNTVLGTATRLRLIALIPALPIFLLIYGWQTDGQSPMLGMLLGCTLLLPVLQIFDTWLLGTSRMRESALAGSAAVASSALLRMALVAVGAGIVGFGATFAAEVLFIGGFLWLHYRRSGPSLFAWHFDRREAVRLIRDAMPLLLTNIAILIYRRCDLLMVARQLDEHSAGLYAAAVKLTEIGYVLPMILVNACFPRLTQLHAEDAATYRIELARFYRLVTWLGIGFGLISSLLAPWLIPLVLGVKYTGAISPFIIYSWTAVFIAQGIARSQWLLLENKLMAGFVFAATSAGINLALNLCLIPLWGLKGAAIAAIGALAINLLVLPSLTASTREACALSWRALWPWTR